MTKTYTEKLRNPQWQKRRLEILQRDDFTCQLCFDKETELHIHHKYYLRKKDVWEYPDDALVTYCKHCHSVVEDLKDVGLSAVISIKHITPYTETLYVFAIAANTKNDKLLVIFKEDKLLQKLCWALCLPEESSRQIKDLLTMSDKLAL